MGWLGEHVGDAVTHKLLDDDTKKILSDLLSDPQILPIPTSIWYQMEGRAPGPPNQLSLSGLGKMIVNPNKPHNDALIRVTKGTCNNQTETRSEQDMIVPSFPYC